MAKHDEATNGSEVDGVTVTNGSDQYADGAAARVWPCFIGDAGRRARHSGAFLRRVLRARGARTVLDVACGTGADSVPMLEAGFEVTSCDASDRMLKHALRTRWARRRDPRFDAWVVEEADWLTLEKDLREALELEAEAPSPLYDAVICLGNSFAHLHSPADQRKALANMWARVAPGGVLVVDHRNYDAILRTGATPSNCALYNNEGTAIRTSVLYQEGNAKEVVMDYVVEKQKFRLTYFPHRLNDFCALLREALSGPAPARHTVYADFQPLPTSTQGSDVVNEDGQQPAVYVHVLEKAE